MGAREDTLLTRAMAGDRSALVELLEQVGMDVRRRIAAKVSPAWRAVLDEDDVMQVTYLEVVLRFATFQTGGVDGFKAWVARLAENNLVDAVRSLEAAKRPNPSNRVGGGARPNADDSAVALVEMLGATMSTPSRHAARDEAGRFLEAALRTLPPDYERVIRLFDLSGKAPAEVAAEMGRSQGAIFMLRARAHERLREAMGPESKFFSRPS